MDPALPGLMVSNERAAFEPALSSFSTGRHSPFSRGAGLPSTPAFGVRSPPADSAALLMCGPIDQVGSHASRSMPPKDRAEQTRRQVEVTVVEVTVALLSSRRTG